MSLNKVKYTSHETIISAQNLNDIQDNIIENANNISDLKTQQTSYYAKNLLRNSDFRSEHTFANSKGLYGYEDGGKTIDGWELSNSSYIVREGSGGYITIIPKEGTNSTVIFRQYIDLTQDLQGKTVTLAAKLRTPKARLNVNGNYGSYHSLEKDSLAMTRSTIITYTTTLPTEGDSFWASVQLGHNLNQMGVDESALGDKGTRIEWIALYLGKYTTETLPIHQPNDKGYEFLINNLYNPANNEFIGAGKFTGSPRNLLDNSNFLCPVNQRGQTIYTATGLTTPCFDRWKICEWGHAQVELTDNGLLCSNLAADKDVGILRQNIHPSRLSSDKDIDKAKYFTVAAKINNEIYCSNGSWNSDIVCEMSGIGSLWLRHSSTTGGAAIRLRLEIGVTNVLVEWIAVYEGQYQKDTLPLYSPKSYDEELAICQKYYKKYTASSNVTLGTGVAVGSQLWVGLPIGPMAEIRDKDTGVIIIPTLEGITNLACTNSSISKSNVTAVSIATYDPNAGHITLRVTTSASITNNNIYRLGLYTEKTFVIANEL